MRENSRFNIDHLHWSSVPTETGSVTEAVVVLADTTEQVDMLGTPRQIAETTQHPDLFQAIHGAFESAVHQVLPDAPAAELLGVDTVQTLPLGHYEAAASIKVGKNVVVFKDTHPNKSAAGIAAIVKANQGLYQM